jgi:hypothetical protein
VQTKETFKNPAAAMSSDGRDAIKDTMNDGGCSDPLPGKQNMAEGTGVSRLQGSIYNLIREKRQHWAEAMDDEYERMYRDKTAKIEAVTAERDFLALKNEVLTGNITELSNEKTALLNKIDRFYVMIHDEMKKNDGLLSQLADKDAKIASLTPVSMHNEDVVSKPVRLAARKFHPGLDTVPTIIPVTNDVHRFVLVFRYIPSPESKTISREELELCEYRICKTVSIGEFVYMFLRTIGGPATPSGLRKCLRQVFSIDSEVDVLSPKTVCNVKRGFKGKKCWTEPMFDYLVASLQSSVSAAVPDAASAGP